MAELSASLSNFFGFRILAGQQSSELLNGKGNHIKKQSKKKQHGKKKKKKSTSCATSMILQVNGEVDDYDSENEVGDDEEYDGDDVDQIKLKNSSELKASMVELHGSQIDMMTDMAKEVSMKANVDLEYVLKAINAMFENNLKYDDPSEVFQFVEEMKKRESLGSFKTVTTSSHSVHDSSSDVTDHSSLPPPTTPVTTTFHPLPPTRMNIQERLNLAASYAETNVQDSLSALCAWASISLRIPQTTAPTLLLPLNQMKEKQRECDSNREAFFDSNALEILLANIMIHPNEVLIHGSTQRMTLLTLLNIILHPTPSDSLRLNSIEELILKPLDFIMQTIGSLRMAGMDLEGVQLIAKHISSSIKQSSNRIHSSLNQHDSSRDPIEDRPSEKSDKFVHKKSFEDTLTHIDETMKTLQDQLDHEERIIQLSSEGNEFELAVKARVKCLFSMREVMIDKLQLCTQNTLPSEDSAKKNHETDHHPPHYGQSHGTTTTGGGSMKMMGVNGASEKNGMSHKALDSTKDLEKELLIKYKLPMEPFHQKVLKTRSVSQNLDSLSRDRESRLHEILTERSRYQLHLEDLQRAKQSLQDKLSELEGEMQSIQSKVQEIELKRQQLDLDYMSKSDSLIKSQTELNSSMHLHEPLNNTLVAVQELESNLYTMIQSSIAASDQMKKTVTNLQNESKSIHKNGMDHVVDHQKEATIALNTLTAYIANEAKCAKFLIERVNVSRDKCAEKERELSAYQQMNLKGMMSQTEEAIEKLRVDLNEDILAIQHLERDVATALRNVNTLMMSSLPNYKSGLMSSVVPMEALSTLERICTEVSIELSPELRSLLNHHGSNRLAIVSSTSASGKVTTTISRPPLTSHGATPSPSGVVVNRMSPPSALVQLGDDSHKGSKIVPGVVLVKNGSIPLGELPSTPSSSNGLTSTHGLSDDITKLLHHHHIAGPPSSTTKPSTTTSTTATTPLRSVAKSQPIVRPSPSNGLGNKPSHPQKSTTSSNPSLRSSTAANASSSSTSSIGKGSNNKAMAKPTKGSTTTTTTTMDTKTMIDQIGKLSGGKGLSSLLPRDRVGKDWSVISNAKANGAAKPFPTMIEGGAVAVAVPTATMNFRDIQMEQQNMGSKIPVTVSIERESDSLETMEMIKTDCTPLSSQVVNEATTKEKLEVNEHEVVDPVQNVERIDPVDIIKEEEVNQEKVVVQPLNDDVKEKEEIVKEIVKESVEGEGKGGDEHEKNGDETVDPAVEEEAGKDQNDY